MSATRTDNLRTMANGLSKIHVIKKRDIVSPERSRSELTLLYELIERNQERAEVFLERLRNSVVA